jgi:hypothetical protein
MKNRALTVFLSFGLFALVLGICPGTGEAQFRELGPPEISSRLELVTEPLMPARVYLTKLRVVNDMNVRTWTPFRLSPSDVLFPIKTDNFYRERFWYRSEASNVLEVLCRDRSHFILLKGKAEFDLPPGIYRVEAYRGYFHVPFVQEFELKPGERGTVALKLVNWAGSERDEWLSSDSHIHITRSGKDDEVLLGWLEAEDLNLMVDLHLQRQSECSVQFGFGPEAEARRGRTTIRSGEESRSEPYGHTLLLGAPELIRPISAGIMYSNSPVTYPFPSLNFDKCRTLGGIPGFAHFNGSMKHSNLLMCLALGKIDVAEVFAFGYLNTEGWHELLNAGLRFTGISGSDFPVQLGRTETNDWPSYLSLLGPERTLVRTNVVGSLYETWASVVKKGGSDVIVTNGPLVDLKVDEKTRTATAGARFFRPLESLEIVVNGKVIAVAEGDGRKTALTLSAKLPEKVSIWVAARVRAHKGPAGESDADIQAREETARKSPAYHLPALALKGEPIIQAHTNPIYVLHKGKPVFVPEAREQVAKRWEAELDYYRTAPLVFENDHQKRGFFDLAEKALTVLRNPPSDRPNDSN